MAKTSKAAVAVAVAAAIGALEAEFLKVTGELKPRKDRQDHLVALHKAATEKFDANEKLWNKLSEPAQEWYNVNAGRLKAEKALREFPDTPKAAPAGKADKKAKKSDPDAGDGKAEKKAKKEKKPNEKRSAVRFFAGLMLKHPEWDKERLLKETNKAGLPIKRSDNMYYNGRIMRSVAAELGLFKMPSGKSAD